MSLTCSKFRFATLMMLAIVLAACKSAPPEDDLPVKPRASSSSSAKASSSAASSAKSSSSSSSAASSSSSASQSSSSSEAAKAKPVSSKNSKSTSSSAPSETTAASTPAPVVIPPEAQSKFTRAMNQVYAGKVDEGALLLEQVASSYPTLSVPYINEGLMYLKANQFEAAERALKHAVERDAKSAVANNYLGVAQRNLGKFKDAEASYQAALAADDNYAAAHLNLAVLYDLYLQKPEQALPHYDRYMELVPAPDTKIAGWVKEIRTRMGVNKKPAAPAPDATPTSPPADADAGAKQ